MTTNLVVYYNMESRIKHIRNKNLMGYTGLTRQIILSVMTAKVARFVWLSAYLSSKPLLYTMRAYPNFVQ